MVVECFCHRETKEEWKRAHRRLKKKDLWKSLHFDGFFRDNRGRVIDIRLISAILIPDDGSVPGGMLTPAAKSTSGGSAEGCVQFPLATSQIELNSALLSSRVVGLSRIRCDGSDSTLTR